MIVLGARTVATGKHTLGSPGRPAWNFLTIRTTKAIPMTTAGARVLGMLLIAMGAFAVWRAVVTLLAG